MSKSVLQLRVQKKIQRVLQDIFIDGDISYKNEKIFISVSDVDISPDFKNLKIFLDISNLNLSIKKEIIKKLNKEDIYIIKKVLAKKINLKFVPEPFFVLDESNAKIFKINEILKKDREKQKI